MSLPPAAPCPCRIGYPIGPTPNVRSLLLLRGAVFWGGLGESQNVSAVVCAAGQMLDQRIRHSSPSREDLESVSEFCRAAIWSLVWSPPTSASRSRALKAQGLKAPIVLAARHPARRGTALPAAWAFAARVHSSHLARARIVGRSHRWASGDWSGSRHSQMEDVASALSRARCDGAQ